MPSRTRPTVLVTGGSGFIGAKFVSLQPPGWLARGTYTQRPFDGGVPLDVRDQYAVLRTFEHLRPTLVVHAAAYSDCDKCEINPELAADINVRGTQHVMEACAAVSASLIFLSSAYVFDGKDGNYNEDDEPRPVNWLGRTKQLGEALAASLADHLIIRFSISYGYNGPKLDNGLLGAIISGRPLALDDTELRQPPLIDDVVTGTYGLFRDGHRGVFHMGGPQVMTKYQLGKALCPVAQTSANIAADNDGDRMAQRPLNAQLDCRRVTRLGFNFRSVQESVPYLKKSINLPKSIE